MSWSRDGTKLFFDRYWGQPVGVYTILPLGGKPVRLLERAFQPQALPDGSLLVARVSNSLNQIFRFWPQNGKLQPLPAFLDLADVAVPFGAFADGRQMAYFGRATGDAAQPNALRVLNLESGAVRTLDPRANIDASGLLSLPLAVTPDGKVVITLARRGDTYDLIQVGSDGAAGHRVLMTLRSTELPWFVEAAPDGSLYLDQIGRPSSILQLSTGPQPTEQHGAPILYTGPLLTLEDGRVVAVGIHGGRSRLLIGTPGSELGPFLQSDEPVNGPLARAGDGVLAAIVGSNDRLRIALASTSDGRILREIPLPAGAPSGLAVSRDRAVVYYAHNGVVYALAESAAARRLGEGDTITMDPSGRYLYTKQFSHNPIRLVRIDTVSGEQTAIAFPAESRLTQLRLSPTAVDANQRMLLDVSSPLTWFYRPAVLDLRTGALASIRSTQVGDCLAPGWAGDGSILCEAVGLTGSLWRYHRDGSVSK